MNVVLEFLWPAALTDMPRGLSQPKICLFKKQKQTNTHTHTHKPLDTENRLMVARGGHRGCWGVRKMGERSQKVPTSSYQINKSWGYYVQHG